MLPSRTPEPEPDSTNPRDSTPASPTWDQIDDNDLFSPTGNLLTFSRFVPQPRQPIPYVRDMDQTGTLSVGWSNSIDRNSLANFPAAKIAVEDSSTYDDTADMFRRLESTFDEWNEEPDLDLIALKNSVQIAIKHKASDDEIEQKRIAFEWFPISFDDEEMKFKIEFNDTSQLSDGFHNEYELNVIFWETKFFESKGIPIQAGTTLSLNLLGQVSKKE